MSGFVFSIGLSVFAFSERVNFQHRAERGCSLWAVLFSALGWACLPFVSGLIFSIGLNVVALCERFCFQHWAERVGSWRAGQFPALGWARLHLDSSWAVSGLFFQHWAERAYFCERIEIQYWAELGLAEFVAPCELSRQKTHFKLCVLFLSLCCCDGSHVLVNQIRAAGLNAQFAEKFIDWAMKVRRIFRPECPHWQQNVGAVYSVKKLAAADVSEEEWAFYPLAGKLRKL